MFIHCCGYQLCFLATTQCTWTSSGLALHSAWLGCQLCEFLQLRLTDSHSKVCIQSGYISLRQLWVRLGLCCSRMQLWFMSHTASPLNRALFCKGCLPLKRCHSYWCIPIPPSSVEKYAIWPWFKFTSSIQAVYYYRQACYRAILQSEKKCEERKGRLSPAWNDTAN